MKALLGQLPHDFEIQLIKKLSLALVDRDLKFFPNGEISLNLSSSEAETVLVIPSYTPDVHEYLMEAQVLCYGAKKQKSRQVILLLPYLPYSRQDQGLYLGHLMIQQCIAAGADHIITLDIHNPDLIIPFPTCQNISIEPVFSQDISMRFAQKDLIIIAPDEGSHGKVAPLAASLSIPCFYLKKTRHQNQVTFAPFDMSLDQKIVLLIDDMIDTASTMVKATHMIKACGAREIHGYGTHAVLSPPAQEIIQSSPLDSLTVTNTLPLKEMFSPLRIIDASWVLAPQLTNLFNKF